MNVAFSGFGRERNRNAARRKAVQCVSVLWNEAEIAKRLFNIFKSGIMTSLFVLVRKHRIFWGKGTVHRCRGRSG